MKKYVYILILIAAVVGGVAVFNNQYGGNPESSIGGTRKTGNTSLKESSRDGLSSFRELGFRKYSLSETEARFQLSSLDGEPVRLSDYTDSWVILKFWASACHVCRQELPLLQKFQEGLDTNSYRLLAVNLQDQPEKVRAFKREHDLTYQFAVARDRDVAHEIARSYQVRVYPTTVIVNPEGQAVMSKQGISAWHKEEFQDKFRRIF